MLCAQKTPFSDFVDMSSLKATLETSSSGNPADAWSLLSSSSNGLGGSYSSPPKSCASADGGEDSDISTTLYLGNLHPFAQQRSLEDLCGYFGQLENTKFIKEKNTGTSAGYGFVKFCRKEDAEAALQALNGKDYLGQELRVNWALPNNHKEDTSHHCHVFVGDLASDVTDAILYNAFCTIGQCSDARVMWDHATGWSKGYGFVSFRRKEDAEAAIAKMQGKQVGSRRVRVGWAQHKQDDNATRLDFETIDRADPANTNVYIGNIAPETREADMLAHFAVHGPVAEVKLHKKGGYGFAKFELHASAARAIVAAATQPLHGRLLKCSWGKNNSSSRRSSSSASSALTLAAALQNATPFAEPAPLPAMLGQNAHNMIASLAAAANHLPPQHLGNHLGLLPHTGHAALALPNGRLGMNMNQGPAQAAGPQPLLGMPQLYNGLLDLTHGAPAARLGPPLAEPRNAVAQSNASMYGQVAPRAAPAALDNQTMLTMMMLMMQQQQQDIQGLQANTLPALNPAALAALQATLPASNTGLGAHAQVMHGHDAMYGAMHGMGMGRVCGLQL